MKLWPKTGRMGPVRRRSAPGEPPAVQYGDLYRSVRHTRIGPYHYRVGSDLYYAKTLEFDSVHRAPSGRLFHVAARPWLRPALHWVYRHVPRMFGKAEIQVETRLER